MNIPVREDKIHRPGLERGCALHTRFADFITDRQPYHLSAVVVYGAFVGVASRKKFMGDNLVLGIDAAWTSSNPSGVALARGEAGHNAGAVR
jgi:hypothetical protein